MDDIEVQDVSAQMQQSDKNKILLHEDEVDTGAQGVSVQMPQSFVQDDNDKILQRHQISVLWYIWTLVFISTFQYTSLNNTTIIR